MELTAMCGYLFIPLFINMLASLSLSPLIYSGISIYTSLAMAYFLVRNLQQGLAADASDSFSAKSKVYYFLIFAGIMQFILAFCLGVWPEFS
jgi:hypothetical protein